MCLGETCSTRCMGRWRTRGDKSPANLRAGEATGEDEAQMRADEISGVAGAVSGCMDAVVITGWLCEIVEWGPERTKARSEIPHLS